MKWLTDLLKRLRGYDSFRDCVVSRVTQILDRIFIVW